MDYKKIDEKWNAYWENNKCHAFNKNNANNKYYSLEGYGHISNE